MTRNNKRAGIAAGMVAVMLAGGTAVVVVTDPTEQAVVEARRVDAVVLRGLQVRLYAEIIEPIRADPFGAITRLPHWLDKFDELGAPTTIIRSTRGATALTASCRLVVA